LRAQFVDRSLWQRSRSNSLAKQSGQFKAELSMAHLSQDNFESMKLIASPRHQRRVQLVPPTLLVRLCTHN
jgi:hypothetical protein